MTSDLLKDLTEPQREAVTHVDGPLLVIAGAGSGKTRVITRRVAHLISVGIKPWHVLAITFTNKAAGEMKDRIHQIVETRGVWVSTFHSLCARMLRQYPGEHGISPDFSIADTADQLVCIKEAMTKLQMSTKNFSPNTILSAISRAKNGMMSPEEHAKAADGYFAEMAAKVHATYQQLLESSNLIDFDDLLMKVALLLQQNREFLDHWSNRFRYILIDEYQDTNHSQYTIAHSLAAARRNICATGDPDQSIYGWRGADISNILDFEQDYPDAKVVKLGQNYRSTKTILQAASSVIENNLQRIDRGVWTDNPTGEQVCITKCSDEGHEAKALAALVLQLRKEDVSLSDMAIFYRTHAQSRPLEAAFINAKVPYTILDAVAFYGRQEIKDVVAYLRLCVNPSDDVSLQRIINVPTRGIGGTTVKMLKAWAEEKQVPLCQAVERVDEIEDLKPRAKTSVKAFAGILKTLRGESTFPVSRFISRVIEVTAYSTLLDKEGEASRKENVSELVNAAAEYDKICEADVDVVPEDNENSNGVEERDHGSLAGFLEQIALVSDTDKEDGSSESVTLMTLHSAKGLEFPVVFIPGCEENLLPHSNSQDEERQIEEERRLFYVGMTRAKERLVLLCADRRAKWGKTEVCEPSRFLTEIPTECCELFMGDYADLNDEDDLWDSENSNSKQSQVVGRRAAQTIELEPEELATGSGLKKGDIVQHPSFGIGQIMALTGSQHERRAKVAFEKAGVRTLVLKYAKLEKVVSL